MRLLCILVLIAAALIAAKIPLDGREAHQRADAVLWPAFISISNDYALQHGFVTDSGHLDKIDAKDKQRFDATVQAFKAWQDAMKQAGY
jgi:hypothetical protein